MKRPWIRSAVPKWLLCLGLSSLVHTHPVLAQNFLPEGNPGNLRPSDKPDRLPDELPSLLTPPKEPIQGTPRITYPADLQKRKSGYDPSYLFLPERNPGERQPPCPCLPLGKYWLNTSYFLGTTRNESLPLISNVNPGDSLRHPFRSGMNVDAGLWLDRCQNTGVEAHFLLLEGDQSGFTAPLAQGQLGLSTPLSFFGGGLDYRLNLVCEDQYRLDFVGGYRFYRLSETLKARTSETSLSGDLADREVLDEIRTRNEFHGKMFGLLGEYRRDRWYVDGALRFSLGFTRERVEIAGATQNTFRDGRRELNPGGNLARPTNMGSSKDSEFAVAPEANMVVGYQVGDYSRAFVGYSFLYLSQVARPGEVIDPVVGIGHPVRKSPGTDFWLQGIHLGVELRY